MGCAYDDSLVIHDLTHVLRHFINLVRSVLWLSGGRAADGNHCRGAIKQHVSTWEIWVENPTS